MSLIDEAQAEGRAVHPKCGVAVMLAEHPDISDEFEAALESPAVTASGLSRALKTRYGTAPTGQTINRHRKHECACD